jgi:uncharacterized protein (TIGR02145 family)
MINRKIMKYSILFLAGLTMIAIKTQSQTVTDYDGNVYSTININGQEWMQENLKVTHYLDGSAIPNITSNTLWTNLTSGAYCDYKDTNSNSIIYGRLYNWYATSDRRICPEGWNVPTHSDWNVMEKYLDNSVDTSVTSSTWVGNDIGNKLKEVGTNHWNYPNLGATNSSGFTALGASFRYPNGTFGILGNDADFWTSTTFSTTDAWFRHLYTGDHRIGNVILPKNYGFSIRCIRRTSINGIMEGINPEGQIYIYPIPATDRVFLNNVNLQNATLRIFSIIGTCVTQQELSIGTNEIDISFLSSGIYLIFVSNPDTTFQKKLIKE